MNPESLTPDTGTPLTDARMEQFRLGHSRLQPSWPDFARGLEHKANVLMAAIEKHQKTMTMRPDFVDEELWAVLASVKGGQP